MLPQEHLPNSSTVTHSFLLLYKNIPKFIYLLLHNDGHLSCCLFFSYYKLRVYELPCVYLLVRMCVSVAEVYPAVKSLSPRV